MQDKDFDYVRAVARRRNFSRAAEELYIAQPALSRYIRKLEERLGVALFDRSSVPVSLTAAGHRFLAFAESVSALETEMMGEFEKMRQAAPTRLCVGAPLLIGDYILPRIMSRLLRDGDNAGMELHSVLNYTVMLIDMLTSHKLDAALFCSSFTAPGFHVELVMREPIVLAARRDHPALAGYDTGECDIYHPLQVDLKTLEGEQFILCNPSMLLYHLSREYLQRVGVNPPRLMETPSIQLSMELATQGIGFACIMQSMVKYGRHEIGQALCPIALPGACVPVYLAYCEQDWAGSSALRRLVDCIREEYLDKEL